MNIDAPGYQNSYDEAFRGDLTFRDLKEHTTSDTINTVFKTDQRAEVVLASIQLCTAGRHKAIYQVIWREKGTFMGTEHAQGDVFRRLCEYHGCPYQYHHYLKASMPPGCFVIRIAY